MKFGFRTPSLKKRITARTSIKRQVVQRAGLKMPRGWGWLRNPKKYGYNKMHNRTSFDALRLWKSYLNRLPHHHIAGIEHHKHQVG